MAKKQQTKQQPYKKYIRWMWTLFFSGILGLILLFGGAALEWYGPMPDLQQLENPRTNLATQIISADGRNFREILFRR